MSKKIVGIILACAIATIVVTVLVVPHLLQTPTPKYTLSVIVSPPQAGAVSPSGGKCLRDVQVTLTATPATGYRFVNWTGDVDTVADVNSTSAVISMNDDYSITANFAPDIIEIRDWYDLDAVRDNLDGSYLLMNDLDYTTAGYLELASETANGGTGWEPIGASDDGFTGNFNGQGYEMRDLFLNRPDQDYVGLFAYVSWTRPIDNVGLIENVGVVNARVTGYYRVGVLVGDNAGIVSNSYSTCSATSGGHYVGGLVGHSDGGFVSNAYSTGNVTGTRYIGGLVGRITGARTVREGTVRNCYSVSTVTGGTRVGGLVGGTYADVEVSNSYFTGSVTGNRWVGGLVAENYGGNVTNSYSTGNVTGNGYVGGLTGFNLWGTISSCYSTSTVSGDGPVGGLVGDNSEGTVNNSFWDTQTSGQPTSDGGTGIPTAGMKNMSTFSGAAWNITAIANPDIRNPSYIWNIGDGQTYPFLGWQSVS
jgi:uncharacterized repeat protein (TIGR02543 family)